MTDDVSKTLVDRDRELADCASEPIRTPGAIQPHGYLMAFDARTRVVRHASANLAALLGVDATRLLGRSVTEALDAADAARLLDALAALDAPELVADDPPLLLSVDDQVFDGCLHRSGGLVVLELEPHVEPAGGNEPVLARVLRRLQGAADLQALHEAAVREVRHLTGFDRVVVYAFDRDDHGSVIAEARADDMAPYLGLKFPATDIPAQARELYRQNWIRMIPDVDYEPVPIVGWQAVIAEAPLDLTFSQLRSVSPVHRDYMRHMGVAASLSISLIRDNELWGLISCVHRCPRHLQRDIRTACLSIARLLSLQISALESVSEATLDRANVALLAPLVEAMHDSPEDVPKSLQAVPDDLLALTAAHGAAIVVGDDMTLMGDCPSHAQVVDLADWVYERAALPGSFAAADLPFLYPPAHAFADVASGVLAITLPKPGKSMVLWFRPEVARIVDWAGEPRKLPTADIATGIERLGPRHSFDAWRTLVHHRADAWGAHRLQAARDLRRSAIEIDLATQVTREQAAVAARNELVAVVSHDLRSPMSVVSLQALLLNRMLVTETSPAARRMLASVQSIQRATSRMNSMLTDLLDNAAIEAGRFSVDMLPVAVDSLFDDALALLAPIAESKGISLLFDAVPGMIVKADAERFYQIISNLVGNALKFTAEGGDVRVSAANEPNVQGLVRFAVADTGCGMEPGDLAHMFERYWKARKSSHVGAGLGLYIASGIVRAHGGSIWASSEVHIGTTIFFTLPAAATSSDS